MKRMCYVIMLFVLVIPIINPVNSERTVVEEEVPGMIFLQIHKDGILSPTSYYSYSENVSSGYGLGIVQRIPLLWTEIGTWETTDLHKELEILSDITCNLDLSADEEMEVEMRLTLTINGVDVGGGTETLTIYPERVTFLATFNVEEDIVEQGGSISIKWEVRGLSDEITYYAGGEDGSGMEFLGQSVYFLGGYYRENNFDDELILRFIDSFDVQIVALSFDITINGLSRTYALNGNSEGAYVEILVDGSHKPGEYEIEWSVLYRGGSSDSGWAVIVLDRDSPPPIDDDLPVDDDNDELWSEGQCTRTYTDASSDDVTYWTSFDASLNIESGVELDNDPKIDIYRVEVYKDGQDLVIEIKMNNKPMYGITDDGIYMVYLYFLDAHSGHRQPPLYLGKDPDMSDEDYEPYSAVATTSLFSIGPYWIHDMEVSGSSYVIRGSISSLMSDGVDPEFELFVKVEFTDLETSAAEDKLTVTSTTDYAGFGAWEVDPSLLYVEGSDQDLGIFGSGNILIYGASIMVIAFLAVAIIAYFVVRKKGKKTVPVYAEYSYVS